MNISFIVLNLKCSHLWGANSAYFQQRYSNWDIDFLNSSLDSKLGYFNVGLGLHFKLFPNLQKDCKLGLLIVALVEPLAFLKFMKEMENWDFWLSPFIFCQAVRIVFRDWYVCRRGGTMICKISLYVSMQMLTNF